jgi:dCTP diphosphatase
MKDEDRQGLDDLRKTIRRFNAARRWQAFHSPKNLAMALCVEAAELLEHFQWLTEEQSRALPAKNKTKVGEELADVLIYLVNLADQLDIDLLAVARDKIILNERKYPIAKARGNALKYSELDDQ